MTFKDRGSKLFLGLLAFSILLACGGGRGLGDQLNDREVLAQQELHQVRSFAQLG